MVIIIKNLFFEKKVILLDWMLFFKMESWYYETWDDTGGPDEK